MRVNICAPVLRSEIPIPEILDPDQHEATELGLRSAAREWRLATAKLAYFSFRWMLCEGWTRHGYEAGTAGENRFREDILGVPRSTYYRARRIGQTLHNLSLEEMEGIRPSNLDLLVEIDATIWHDHRWVQEAKALKPKEFAELVAARNHAAGSNREPLALMTFKMPFLAKEAVETMLKDFQKKHDLSSPARALELLVADKHDRPNLLSTAQQAAELVRGALKAMEASKGKLTNSARSWLELAEGSLRAVCKETIQASRQEAEDDGYTSGRDGEVPAE